MYIPLRRHLERWLLARLVPVVAWVMRHPRTNAKLTLPDGTVVAHMSAGFHKWTYERGWPQYKAEGEGRSRRER